MPDPDIQRLINEQRKLANENNSLRDQLSKKERQINEIYQHLSSVSLEVQEICFQLLTTISIAMEMRDKYAKNFAEKVSQYGIKTAKEMGLAETETELVRRAGYLLEIGRLGLREDLFTKMERLTEEEYELVKSHTEIAKDLLKPLKFMEEIIPVVRHHHERYDGNGYPDGLKGNKIPIGSRILAVTSTYVAMTQSRPHRKALDLSHAELELRNGGGTQFDPEVVEAFIRVLEKKTDK